MMSQEAMTAFTVGYLTHIASLHSYWGQKVGHT